MGSRDCPAAEKYSVTDIVFRRFTSDAWAGMTCTSTDGGVSRDAVSRRALMSFGQLLQPADVKAAARRNAARRLLPACIEWTPCPLSNAVPTGSRGHPRPEPGESGP